MGALGDLLTVGGGVKDKGLEVVAGAEFWSQCGVCPACPPPGWEHHGLE